MGFLGKSLISLDDFTLADIDHLLQTAQRIKHNRKDFAHVCDEKILATLFFEPSTRTKLSFESAMLRMGGNVLGFGDPGSSSMAKGESVADAIRVMSSYADVAVVRHPKEGSAKLAAEYATIPIINGGDGGHQHPTQTLTDLLTILETKGSLYGHRIAFCGDLRFGRTVHSLIAILARYQIEEFILISPPELELPSTLQQRLVDRNVVLRQYRQLEEVIAEADVLYMTRIQRERFFSEAEYRRLKDSFLLDKAKLTLAKPDLRVLHPLPRVNEIAYEVDADPRAAYFEQAAMGVYVRMALLALQLGVIE